MNYKVFIYICMLLLSAFALSSVNFDGFIKSKHVIEARTLAFLLMLGLAYISGSFIISLIEVM